MGVSKVVLGEETLVDLTSDSVSEENLLEGATAHGADGEPVKGIVEIKPKTLTTTKTGEQIHLVDSTDNKVVEFALYGKATQDRTPSPENHVDIVVAGESYNLLEITPKSQTVNGVVFTVNSDGSVSVAGKETSGNNSGFMLTNTLVLPAGQYVVSHGYNGSFNTMWLYVHTKETQTFLCNVTNIEQTITLTEKTTIQMSIYVKAGVTINNDKMYPMIRKASVPNDRYMPYGVGSVEVRTYLPLINEIPMEQGAISSDKNEYSKIKVASARRIRTVDIIDTKNSKVKIEWNDLIYDLVYQYFGMDEILYESNNDSNIWYSTSPKTANSSGYIAIAIKRKDGANITVEEFENVDLKILIDGKETTATIPTPNGLAGIKVDNGGNYTDSNGQQWLCDEIVKYADGSGAYVQRIEKVIFDGSEDEPWSLNETNNNTVRCVCDSNSKFNIKGNSNAISDKLTFIGKTVNNNYNESIGILDYCCFNIRDSLVGFTFRLPSTITSVDGIREYLSVNNITVYYCLAEPIHTPLTAEQIAEVEKLCTFYPVTNISNDFDCGTNVEYVLEKVITTQAPIPVIPSTEIEELKSGDTTLTLFGKIKKWLTSIKPHAFLNPVNNLLATVSGSALDATQGKVLNDKISTLNESLKWKLVGKVTGKTEVTLPNDFDEICVTLRIGDNGYTLNIPRLDLTSTIKRYREGKGICIGSKYYLTQIRIQVSLTSFSLEEWNDSENTTTTNNTNKVEVAVYTR